MLGTRLVIQDSLGFKFLSSLEESPPSPWGFPAYDLHPPSKALNPCRAYLPKVEVCLSQFQRKPTPSPPPFILHKGHS